jgi:Ca2+-binding RTX toxin-like protein
VTTVTGLTAALSITHAEATDRFVFAGGTGTDTVDASAFAGGIGLDFQGGEGTDALVIRGADKVANTIQLFGGQATPDGASIDVVVNGAAAHANLLDVETLAVSGGSEGDVINAAGLQAGQALTLDGGKGDDTLTSGQGADTVDGGAGDDLINSGRGADVLRGGAGDDTIVWNPGDGSDVVDGGAGVDTQAFNLANIGEVVSIIDMGGHAILTRNIAGIVMDLDNVERVAFGGPGGGADTFFFGSLAGTEVRQIDVDLGSVPDTLVDNVSASGEASADKIVVTGSAGDARVDGLAATLNVTHAEAIDRLVVSGFGGDDGIDATGFSGGMDLTLWGGGGSDTFTFGHSTGAQVQILDFTPHVLGFGDDVIELNGFAWNSFAEAVVTGHIAQAGADVVISDHDGVIVTLRNVSLSDLTSGDFLFH